MKEEMKSREVSEEERIAIFYLIIFYSLCLLFVNYLRNHKYLRRFLQTQTKKNAFGKFQNFKIQV